MKNLLLVFAKYPIPGFVKTRLARAIGDENAALVFRQFIAQTIETFIQNETDFDVQIAVAQQENILDFERMFPGTAPCFAQIADSDLGMRMRAAIAKKLDEGYRRIAIIGTDCPQLPANYVAQAFAKLQNNDVVIGPASDGGYYLIAVKKDLPRLFEQVDWGTERVFQQTLQVVGETGLSTALLPELYDVDVLDSLMRLQKDMPEFFARFEQEFGERARTIFELLRRSDRVERE